MVHQRMHIGRLEVIQYGNGHCAVCQHPEERYTPSQTVLSAEGHLVALAYPGILKKQM